MILEILYTRKSFYFHLKVIVCKWNIIFIFLTMLSVSEVQLSQ